VKLLQRLPFFRLPPLKRTAARASDGSDGSDGSDRLIFFRD
jgi:hypothetical protein